MGRGSKEERSETNEGLFWAQGPQLLLVVAAAISEALCDSHSNWYGQSSVGQLSLSKIAVSTPSEASKKKLQVGLK